MFCNAWSEEVVQKVYLHVSGTNCNKGHRVLYIDVRKGCRQTRDELPLLHINVEYMLQTSWILEYTHILLGFSNVTQ